MTTVDLSEIVYRNYKEGNEKDIINLFSDTFKVKYTLSQWNWAHKEGPVNHIYVILAFYKSTLVGQSAAIPSFFRHQQKIVQTARVQNVMVHPNFRKRGIFLETLKRLTDYICANGVDFIITFPNDFSIGAFIEKLDYRHLFDVFTFSLPVECLDKDLKCNLTFNFQQSISFRQSDHEFIDLYLKQFYIFNARNTDYLLWRYHKNSGKKYCLIRVFDKDEQVGFAICKPYSELKSIDLVEFIFKTDKDIICASLNAIYNYYKKDNMKSFSIWSMEHYPLHKCLVDIGFRKTEEATHLVYKTLSSKCSSHCNKINSYYLSMGDSDVY